MTSWREEASARKAYRHEAVPEVIPRHSRKTQRPKDFGVAYHSVNPVWFLSKRTRYRWYETAEQRDQAFKKFIRDEMYSFWRVDRADVEAIRAGSSNS